MSFAAKQDLVGLSSTNLIVKSNAQNASNTVLEIVAHDGSIIGDEITGAIKAPTCEYVIKGSVSLSVELGKCYNEPYALKSISIGTSAGGEPSFNATTVQIEPNATKTICTYKTDTITLTPAHHAITFGAFTYTESTSLILNASTFEANADIQPATINNDPVASDSVRGVQTVNATFWSTSETNEPSITIADGWHITTPWTCTGSDGQLYTWTVTLSKYLTAVEG